jgi:autotransporter strand-loop-strand O-heptosyltransferase
MKSAKEAIQSASELNEAERKAGGLAGDLSKAERRTKLQLLTAPVDGVVQQLAVHTVGGVVTPAQQLAVVVPADAALEVEAMVSNRDIGFDHKDCVPCDFRRVGLHRATGYILGVDPREEPPRIALADERRPIADPYVCIAVQSTLQAKYWNNPTCWAEIVRFLKESGYRVICIDLKSTHGKGLVWTQTPPGAEDQTGDQPLIERARWLKHAEFFIGLSSGLSWLAWSMRTPVVMISGVTHPINEFTTPYRVINYHACNSCWNDPLSPFDSSDFLTCPRHKDTPRQFECSRLITAEQVKQTIRRIPGFGVSRRAVA